jgi:hypothetical protein
MLYEDFQDDLFGGQEGQSKPKKKVFPGRRGLPYIKIPLENTVIAAVFVMILVIVAYAIGVERGKKISGLYENISSISESDILDADNLAPDIDMDLKKDNTDNREGTGLEGESEILMAKGEEKDPGQDVITETFEEQEIVPQPLYTVQLASFKQINTALSLVEHLEKEGFNAEYAQRGDWYQVYVCGYYNSKEAEKAMEYLREEYSDCFIRKMK